MAEATLWDYQTKTKYHKADPHTSRVAAQKAVSKLTEKQRYALRLIRTYCQTHADFTPKEVAGGINRVYFDIQRRKNELAEYIKKTGEERGGCEVMRLL